MFIDDKHLFKSCEIDDKKKIIQFEKVVKTNYAKFSLVMFLTKCASIGGTKPVKLNTYYKSYVFS